VGQHLARKVCADPQCVPLTRSTRAIDAQGRNSIDPMPNDSGTS
jgi:hypothetical protein